MENMFEKVQESVKYIKNKVNTIPKIAIILGSGLGDIVNIMKNKISMDYKNIPYFPVSTIDGHGGKLIFGEVNGVGLISMQGRVHYYEGYTMKEIVYPVYVMKMLGVETLIITNACGGINRSFQQGTLMLITDYISTMPDNPLIGINDERFGSRFPDISEPYKLTLINTAKKAGDTLGIDYKEGVYAGTTGPYYKSPAEIKMLGIMGADAVGMSTVPETIAANYLGLNVLGISCIANISTGNLNENHTHKDVLTVMKRASITLSKWIENIIAKL